MHYLIDGYNFIFSLFEVKKSLQSLRAALISSLQQAFTEKKLTGSLIFDGKEQGYSYPSPLTVVYAPKDKSADEYITELVALSKTPKQITVITNDRGLIRHVQSHGAKTQSNEEFLAFLQRKKKKIPKDPVESKTEFNRLLQIFEQRLKED